MRMNMKTNSSNMKASGRTVKSMVSITDFVMFVDILVYILYFLFVSFLSWHRCLRLNIVIGRANFLGG